MFDPVTGVFAPTGDMGTPRSEHTATRLNDGQVLVTGGTGPDGHATATAELFDPTIGVFTPTGEMRSAVYEHVATLLNDGRVFVTGGLRYEASSGGYLAIASADVFDPGSGTFATTGGMATTRAYHTATLLADGTVLVIGGVDDGRDEDGSSPTASAEVFSPDDGTFSATGGWALPLLSLRVPAQRRARPRDRRTRRQTPDLSQPRSSTISRDVERRFCVGGLQSVCDSKILVPEFVAYHTSLSND
jgi:hypothetical protein